MKILSFKKSCDLSLGIELEIQLINPKNYNPIDKAQELIKSVKRTSYEIKIKPEITQSMLELNSSVHLNPTELFDELKQLQGYLEKKSRRHNILFCGGGTHPLQDWTANKIFPCERYKKLSTEYKYLAKRSTVFGMHIHIGCSSPEHALFLIHALARYVPQFIAMSASSPFYNGVNTGYQSTRVTIFNSFPTCGIIPYITTWQEFSEYFYKMRKLDLIQSMKDFYWDIRPQPKFGTIEFRVCDTPLTIRKACLLAAYLQTIASFLFSKKASKVFREQYHVYSHNRFQASRFGLAGKFVDPKTLIKTSIAKDIQATMIMLKDHSVKIGTSVFLEELQTDIEAHQNDATQLLNLFENKMKLRDIVKHQCQLWKSK